MDGLIASIIRHGQDFMIYPGAIDMNLREERTISESHASSYSFNTRERRHVAG